MILIGAYVTLSFTGLFGLFTYLLIKAVLLTADSFFVRVIKVGVGVVFCLFLILTIYPSAFQAKIQKNVDLLTNFNDTGTVASLSDFGSGRGNTWQAALFAVAEAPLIGHGPGNGLYANARFDKYLGRELLSAHNMYLDVASDLGLPGLCLLLFLFINPWLVLWPRKKYNDDEQASRSTNQALFAALAICMVMGFSLTLNILKLPWILIGLGIVARGLVYPKTENIKMKADNGLLQQ
jgi:O-antigen ligase